MACTRKQLKLSKPRPGTSLGAFQPGEVSLYRVCIMSEHLPNFLAVHFDGDFLEHAAFVESEQEWAQLT
ncbi:hypothetical protein LCGC14_2692670, partial [marine sediment metagenome]